MEKVKINAIATLLEFQGMELNVLGQCTVLVGNSRKIENEELSKSSDKMHGYNDMI